jgi:hypothetical protein
MPKDRAYRSKGLRNSSKKRMTSHSISERSGEDAVAAKAGKEMWSIDSMRRIRTPPLSIYSDKPTIVHAFFCKVSHHSASRQLLGTGRHSTGKKVEQKDGVGNIPIDGRTNGEHWCVNIS